MRSRLPTPTQPTNRSTMFQTKFLDSDLETRILFDDGRLIAIDKPAGLETTGRDLDDKDCLQHFLIERAGRMAWAVHQLDRDTSGVVLFVTRKSSVAIISQKMQQPGAKKLYLAFCRGLPTFERRLIDEPLAAPGGRRHERRAQRSNEPASGAEDPLLKPARTYIEVLARGHDAALVACTLLTGRTHQIRRHLANLGHALLGERLYAEPACSRHQRHALHAWQLRLSGADEPNRFTAPLPGDLLALAEALGLDLHRALLRRDLL